MEQPKKPKFDPNKAYEEVKSSKPAFNPDLPFDEVKKKVPSTSIVQKKELVLEPTSGSLDGQNTELNTSPFPKIDMNSIAPGKGVQPVIPVKEKKYEEGTMAWNHRKMIENNPEYVSNYEKFKNIQKVDDSKKQEIVKETEEEFKGNGVWNNIKKYGKEALNLITEPTVTGLASLGSLFSDEDSNKFIDTAVQKSKIETDPFAEEKQQAKNEYKQAVKSANINKTPIPKYNPEEINKRALQIKIDNRIKSESDTQIKDYLKADEETGSKDKTKFITFEAGKYATLQEKDKVLLEKQNIERNVALGLKGELEDLQKEIKTNGLNEENRAEYIDKYQKYQNVVSEAIKTHEQYTDNRKDLGDSAENLDVFKRDYSSLKSFLGNVDATITDLSAGGLGAIDYVLEGTKYITNATPKEQNIIRGAAGDLKSDAEKIRSEIMKPISVDNINNWSDFGDWFFQTAVAQQVPIYGLLATGNVGVGTIGGTSLGNKFEDMQSKIKSGEENYSTAELMLNPVGYGVAETASAMVDQMLLKNAGRVIESATKPERQMIAQGFAKRVLDATKNVSGNVAKGIVTEGLDEGLTQGFENLIDGKPFLDNIKDPIVAGAVMGAVIPLGGHIISQATKPFSTDNQIQNSASEITRLRQELNNPELSETARTAIENDLVKQQAKLEKSVIKVVENVEGLSKEQFNEVVNSETTMANIKDKAIDIRTDDTIDDSIKKQLLGNLQEEFDAVNQRRLDLIERGHNNILETIPKDEVIDLKNQAQREIMQEKNPDGTKNIKINDEEISKRAVQIYNRQPKDIAELQEKSFPLKPLSEERIISEDNTESKQLPELDIKVKKNAGYSGKKGYSGTFLKDYDFLAEGIEHTVYRSKDGKKIIKLANPNEKEKPYNQVVGEALEINQLLGDGSLKVIGNFKDINGNIHPVYEQKFIEGEKTPKQQIRDHLKKLGFITKEGKYPSLDTFLIKKNGEIKSINDIAENFITDKNGNIIAIDASIRTLSPDSISKELKDQLNEADSKNNYTENKSQAEVQESTNELQEPEKVEDEGTQKSDITSDGDNGSGTKPVDEVRVAEQENIVEKPVSETTEPRTSETKVEVTEEEPKTALKNADIAKKRKELGLEERVKVTRKKGDELTDSATKKIKEGYDVGNLIEDILDPKSDRTLTDEEVVILKQYQLAKENRLIQVGEEIISATNEGSSSAKLDKLIQERETLVDDIDKAYRAGEQSGTVTARALQARRLAMLQDYSLANMLIQKRKAIGDQKLTPEQIKETTDDYAKIQKLRSQLEEKILSLEKENAELKAGKNIEGLTREERKNKRKVKIEEIDSDIDATIESLRKKLREQAGRLSANAIPIEMIPDIAKLAQLYVKKGIVKLDDIVDGIYTSLKEDIDNLSKDDIKEIIAEYDYKLEEKNQKRLDSLKKRTIDKIKELKDRLSKQDFEKKQTTPVQLDKEAKQLKEELRKAKFEWDKALEKDILDRRTKLQKYRDNFAEFLSLPRSIMASIDFSAPLRQGLVLTVNNPATASKAFVEMFKQAFSQNRFDTWLEDLKETPQYQVMKDSGLYIADTHSAKLSAKEEQFMSNLANKIPIIGKGFEATVKGKKVKVGGLDLIGGSERAYVSYLNKLRTDVFAKTADLFEKEGHSLENSPELYKALGNYVNSATGRGNLGKFNDSSTILNSLFFSPRLIASRINLLTNWANPVWYENTPAKVRQMYALDMARFIGAGVALLSLASLGGADVEEDPRSSDFGKIRNGDTRWDIWGGFQQFARFFAQMLTGQRKNTNTKQIKDLDGTGFNSETRADVFSNMLRSKLAPVPGTLWNLSSGKTMVGEEYTLKDVPKSFLPLFASDLYKAMERDGAYKGVLETGIPAVFGVGVQTYPQKESSSNEKGFGPKLPSPPKPPTPK